MRIPLLIAHRGLVDGPDKRGENSPAQIDRALGLGFDCEVDLWRVDGKLYLGHDSPTYLVDLEFLRARNLWIHAKNVDALSYLGDEQGFAYFWHEGDAYTLTSNNYIWTFPGRQLAKNSIAVMPEWHDPGFEKLNIFCFGICSDFVSVIKDKLTG